MTNSVICKFWVHAKKDIPNTNKNGEDPNVRVELGAVWEGSVDDQAKSENAIFGKYTPCGEINISLANPEAAKFFEPGQHYYVTFTKADGRFNVSQ